MSLLEYGEALGDHHGAVAVELLELGDAAGGGEEARLPQVPGQQVEGGTEQLAARQTPPWLVTRPAGSCTHANQVESLLI